MNKTTLGLLSISALAFISNSVFGHGMSEEDQIRMLNAGYFEYVRLGATHMLTGYDHLLFLFGVIFFLTRFLDILKFITAFTIGHCITLIFATIYSIQANYYLVDAVIALTVCYKAFDNLDGFKKYLNTNAPNLIWMVFAFGLIHGFGLSTRLQQLPLGEDGIVLRILAFNVGVEVGQVLALTVMLFLLMGWRKTQSFGRFSNAANVSLMIVGGLLLLMQLHGYQHTVHNEEFPINQDDHYHVHQDMNVNQVQNPLENYPRRINLSELGNATKSTTTITEEPAAQTEDAQTHTHDDGTTHSH
ncbi:MAG: HupE/UreJ family protein [Cellvibrionaceae bacterium]